jgi:predicted HTH domain antitoxin
MQKALDSIKANEMNVVPVTVNIPRALLAECGLSVQAASVNVLRAFVLSLYRRDNISSGKAARLLGMHRLAFIRLLAEENIPYLDYTPEELEAEFAAVREWPSQS